MLEALAITIVGVIAPAGAATFCAFVGVGVASLVRRAGRQR